MTVDFFPVYIAGFPLLLLYVARTYFRARAVWEQFDTVPGRRAFISEFSALGRLTGEVKYITVGGERGWNVKHKDHRVHGWDVISSIGLWPTPQGGFIMADANAIKTVFSARQRFPKPVEPYQVLTFFGNNIVTSEFDEWKQHRKIAAPAFNEKNKKLAFEESARAITSLYEEEWHGKQKIVLDNALSLTMATALMTISAAGFGHRVSWKDEKVPPGHRLSFKRSIEFLGAGLFTKLLCPKWIFEWGPTQSIRDARDGFTEFRSYLVEMIEERKLSNEKGEKRDLLSNFVHANEEFLDDGGQRLGEGELIGNVFMFYLAGHETSGHTLCFALNMLAIHQEEQEMLCQHIQSTLPDDRLPTYEDIPRLNRVTATLYETLRMFPPAPVIPKYSVEDTSLIVGNQAGETTVFQIPAGSEITIDTAGLHYNPRYWEDPFSFKPARFLGEWNRDAFTPFSGGARACIGRGFFEATALAMLTILIQHYRVEPHPKFAEESFEQLKEKYSQGRTVVTLT